MWWIWCEGRRYEISPGTATILHKPSSKVYRLRLENDKEAKFESAEVEALTTIATLG